MTYVLTPSKLDAIIHTWVPAMLNYIFSITYKTGRNHQYADAFSSIHWPEVMEMNSQTVKAVCEDVQTSHGKAEVLNHSAQTLSQMIVAKLNLKIPSSVKFQKQCNIQLWKVETET